MPYVQTFKLCFKANIDGDSLKFVYESEACSLWCQALPGDNGVKTSGMRYVTVNIGGTALYVTPVTY